MFQIAPIVEGKSTAIDCYGFYLTAPSTSPCSDSGGYRGIKGEAPSVWCEEQIDALQSEEKYWMGRIVQYAHLRQRYQSAKRRREAHHDDGEGCDVMEDAGPSSVGCDKQSTRTCSDDDGDEAMSDVHSIHCYYEAGSTAETAVPYHSIMRRIAAAMRRRIRLQHGVRFPSIRRVVWGFFTASILRSPSQVKAHAERYQALCSSVIDAEIADLINRDLGRTLPTHCLFRDSASIGQTSLRRILHAYSVLDPAVGYCQGMGFIVSVLLLHCPEEEAFWIFVHMMYGRQFSMRQLYQPGFPLLQQFFIILRRLLKRYCPTLHAHFEAVGIDVAFFAAQWFMTLFSYQLPISFVSRVWDLFISEGWCIVFRVSLALLQWESDALLQMSMEDAMLFLKEFHENKPDEELLRRSLDVPVTEEDLRSAIK